MAGASWQLSGRAPPTPLNTTFIKRQPPAADGKSGRRSWGWARLAGQGEKRTMTLRRTGAIAAVAFIGLTAFASTADAARVAYVVDGDTVRLNSGRYVRLIGYDTPEYGRRYFHAAKRSLGRFIPASGRVDRARDRGGRRRARQPPRRAGLEPSRGRSRR